MFLLVGVMSDISLSLSAVWCRGYITKPGRRGLGLSGHNAGRHARLASSAGMDMPLIIPFVQSCIVQVRGGKSPVDMKQPIRRHDEAKQSGLICSTAWGERMRAEKSRD
jgi:hypothetical protein